jgi:hypothetical protein
MWKWVFYCTQISQFVKLWHINVFLVNLRVFYVKYIKWFLFSRNYVGHTDFFSNTRSVLQIVVDWFISAWTKRIPFTVGLLQDEILAKETGEGVEGFREPTNTGLQP